MNDLHLSPLPTPQEMFSELDRIFDGRSSALSSEAARMLSDPSVFMATIDRNFDQMDLQHKGRLSKEDLLKFSQDTSKDPVARGAADILRKHFEDVHEMAGAGHDQEFVQSLSDGTKKIYQQYFSGGSMQDGITRNDIAAMRSVLVDKTWAVDLAISSRSEQAHSQFMAGVFGGVLAANWLEVTAQLLLRKPVSAGAVGVGIGTGLLTLHEGLEFKNSRDSETALRDEVARRRQMLDSWHQFREPKDGT